MPAPRRTRDVEVNARKRNQRIIINDRNNRTQTVLSVPAARRRVAGPTAGPSSTRRSNAAAQRAGQNGGANAPRPGGSASGLIGRVIGALGKKK